MSDVLNNNARQMMELLKGADWFSMVGMQHLPEGEIRLVHSWAEACQASAHPVTNWCNVEGSLILYRKLASEHAARFANWNEIANAMLTCVNDVLVPHVFIKHRHLTQQAQDWMRSQILGALMEWSFVDCYDVNLFRIQVGYYLQGRFPCGWHVNRPEEFPDQAVLIVF